MIKLSSRINVDKRGKITTGIKKKSESTGKEYPSTTDYFVIDDFPELKVIYGEKPKKLMLVFPTNTIEDFFTADMVLYGSNNAMIRKCDGDKECIHRIDEELTLTGQLDEDGNLIETETYKKKYVAGEFTECVCKLMQEKIEKNGKEIRNPKLCNCAMYLKAFIIDYRTKKIVSPLCYLFYSGSLNTASNIYSELKKIQTIVGGRIAGLPFGLSVDMVSGKTDAKVKYPIWNLQVLGTMAQLELAAESFLFDYKEILQLDKKKDNEGINEEHNLKTDMQYDVVLVKIKKAKTKKELEEIYASLGEEEQNTYINQIQDRADELNNSTDGLFNNDI